jgi:glycerophosphoryl diester phosphodiesterase
MARPLIIAHRGASFDGPENTLAAYRLAWEQGADGAEGDFHLTRDGRIVCMHDRTTGRTGDIELVVSEATFDELRKVDVGVWKDRLFAGERIPTLDEILDLLPDEKIFFIEIKCGAEILPVLREVIANSGVAAERLRILCFNAEVILQSNRLLPGIKAHWLVDYSSDPTTGLKTPTPRTILETLKRIGANGLNSRADTCVLSAEFVSDLVSEGFEVAAWTVDDLALAKCLIGAGVGSLTTNRPGWISRQLGA